MILFLFYSIKLFLECRIDGLFSKTSLHECPLYGFRLMKGVNALYDALPKSGFLFIFMNNAHFYKT